MNNVLITGGAGFIGSNLTNYFVNKYKDTNFIVIDCLNYCSNIENITVQENDNFKFVCGHLQNAQLLEHIVYENNITHIIHCAAESHVDNSFIDPIKTVNENIMATMVLLEIARKYNIKQFIHFSTDEIYGETDTKLTETSNLNPTTPYAASKAGIDMIIQSYTKTFKFPAIIVRPNNIYGRNQYFEKVIPKFITQLLNDENITIHGDGLNKRSFLYVDDLVNAIDHLLFKEEYNNNIYNIGTDEEYTILDISKVLIKKIKHTDDYQNHIVYIDDRIYNDSRYLIDCDHIKNLGWKPNVSFEDGINETIEYYKYIR